MRAWITKRKTCIIETHYYESSTFTGNASTAFLAQDVELQLFKLKLTGIFDFNLPVKLKIKIATGSRE